MISSKYLKPSSPLSHTHIKALHNSNYIYTPLKDLALATILRRPGSTFFEELSKANNFSNEGYGSVNRVYVICDKDKGMTVDFQCWMIKNSPVKEVKEINGADHMAMLSKPDELCKCLLDVANKFT